MRSSDSYRRPTLRDADRIHPDEGGAYVSGCTPVTCGTDDREAMPSNATAAPTAQAAITRAIGRAVSLPPSPTSGAVNAPNAYWLTPRSEAAVPATAGWSVKASARALAWTKLQLAICSIS